LILAPLMALRVRYFRDMVAMCMHFRYRRRTWLELIECLMDMTA
jgi:hypothetical protein